MVRFFSFLAEGDTATSAAQSGGLLGSLMPLVMLGVVGLVMYFMMIRPQKKQKQKETKMREGVRVGDEITTIGGICGRVLNVKEDALVIETGADRSKMTIKKWALSSVDTIHDDPAPDDDDDDDDDD